MTNSSSEASAPRPGLRSFQGVWPRLADRVWVADTARVIGDVTLGEDASVWYGCVLRGDTNFIRVGARTNIQDHSVLHVTAVDHACVVGDEVSVGHRAVVHGCRVGDGALIGIGAVVLDGAQVGCDAAVGAGAVVAPGAKVPDGMLALGVPARVVRALSREEIELQRERTRHYVETARQHAEADA